MSSFIALDVETANPNMSSICQIGVVKFVDDSIVDECGGYINPEDTFSDFNKLIHGIDEETVSQAPTFPEIHESIIKALEGDILTTYTCFDTVALNRACDKYRLPRFQYQYVDASRVVRHTWDKYARDGFGLAVVATDLGIRFNHHNALEDARVAGLILVEAVKQSGIPLEEWVCKAAKSIDLSRDNVPPPTIKRKGNPEGNLTGEVVVFTGDLSMPRIQAATIAAECGCDVDDGVTKRTTMLVVGHQDIRALAGKDKSSKHIKAEKMIREGHCMCIISELDFMKMLERGEM